MKGSGEARILGRIFGEQAKLLHDHGGAVVFQVLGDPYIKYFFIGKQFAKYTSEPYYVTIAVYESNNDLGEIGVVKLRVKKGLLRKAKVLIEGEGPVYDRLSLLLRGGLEKRIAKTLYEELVIREAGRDELESIGGGQAVSSIIVIGRTRLFYSLNPFNEWKRIVELNRELLRIVVNELNQ